MDIKQLLLDGITLTIPYKRALKEWVGEVKIYVFAGYWKKPSVIIDGSVERMEWPLEQIDEAINHFKGVAFSPSNIMYKMQAAIIEVVESGDDVDLDNQKSFDKVNAIRKAKILQTLNQEANEN